jgi:exodeoxyribonuclease III
MPLKLVSWNVNGIRAVHSKGLFDVFLNEVQPDIICLQEIKAQQEQSPLELSGYHEYWNSADKPGYSGTAIFSKIKPLSVVEGLPKRLETKHGLHDDEFGNTNTEGRVLTAEFDEFYLVTCYTPNAKDDLGRLQLRHQKWDPAFLAHVTALAKKKPVAFCGDLNVAHTEEDLARPKPNVGKAGFTDEEREGFGAMLKAGFVDTFRMFTQGNGHYTWWSYRGGARAGNVGWRIDYFLVSEELAPKVLAAEIHDGTMGSDHCPVSITLDVEVS